MTTISPCRDNSCFKSGDKTFDWEGIPGWFGWADIYDEIVNNATGIIHGVEIGIWQGKSTIYMANQIRRSGAQIFFYAFDTFAGSAEHQHEILAMARSGTNLEEIFRRNLDRSGCRNYVRAIKQDSLQAANRFEDGSLDFVFLDGDHRYEAVKADIEAWLPKVKPGGLIAGDDYQASWPGVVQAVDELLPERVIRPWWEYRLPG